MKHIRNEVEANDGTREGCSCGCFVDDPCARTGCPHCTSVISEDDWYEFEGETE